MPEYIAAVDYGSFLAKLDSVREVSFESPEIAPRRNYLPRAYFEDEVSVVRVITPSGLYEVEYKPRMSVAGALSLAGLKHDSFIGTVLQIRGSRALTYDIKGPENVTLLAREVFAGDKLIATPVKKVMVIPRVGSEPQMLSPTTDRNITWGEIAVSLESDSAKSLSLKSVTVLSPEGDSMRIPWLEIVKIQNWANLEVPPGTKIVGSSEESELIHFYVFGEVLRGGMFVTRPPISLTQAASMAGFLQFGSKFEETVYQPQNGAPKVYDVSRFLSGSYRGHVPVVEDGAVIFIPRTTLAEALEYANRIVSALGTSWSGYSEERQLPSSYTPFASDGNFNELTFSSGFSGPGYYPLQVEKYLK
ncbi:MAG: hypothetical protein NUW37_02660 [Planctomycetes bacterium]|nr:hypothetical protein [Planctomycetota bacterium]